MTNAEMAGLLYLGAGIFLILGLAGQRRLWWSLSAWSYRDPERNEPSDAAYRFQRFLYFAVAVMLAIFGGAVQNRSETPDVPNSTAKPTSPAPVPRPETVVTFGPAEVREKAERVLDEAARTKPVEQVPDIIYAEGGGNLTYYAMPPRKEDPWTRHGFEISNREGDHPVCLTLNVQGRSGSDKPESGKVRDGLC